MDILIEPDCFKICRICMENCEDDFICVYDEFEDNILMDVITECARVEIRKDDALPHNACRNCAEYMIIAYHIIQKCRDSDQTLRAIFKHEIDFRSREEEKIYNAANIHVEDINPAEYAFLLSDAYDNIMLETVDELIVMPTKEVDPEDFQNSVHYNDSEQMDSELYQHEEENLSTTMDIKNGHTETGETQENCPLEVKPQLSVVHVRRKCCGCKTEFDDENDLKKHSELVHLKDSDSDEAKPFRCSTCYKSFSSQQLLKQHRRIAIREHFCRQCGKGFMTQENLENHLKCHVSSRETKKCCGCRKDFNSETELLVHSREVHRSQQTSNPDKPYECEVCFRRYPTRKSLVSHKRMIQQHQCAHCGEVFMKKLFLTLHEQSCHPDEREEDTNKRCCGCRLEFPNQDTLREHALLAHKPKNRQDDDSTKSYECEICFKRFSSKPNLYQHQKKANQEKRYACEICGRSFSRAHDKATHVTTHSNEMPFSCHLCPRKFKNKLYLKNHLKLHATSDSKNFVCAKCGKCFRTKDLLKTHSISHSEERKYACNVCPATFKRLQCLKIHIKVHTREKAFGCNICSKRYVQSSDLKRHLLTHNPGEGGKPFQCEYCLKRYPRKDYLKVHIRKQHLVKADIMLGDDVALEFEGHGSDSDFMMI